MAESAGDAEQLKNQGNEALKGGNLDMAVLLYTQSLGRSTYSYPADAHKTEGTFTNRAMAYIKQHKYKEALFDCE